MKLEKGTELAMLEFRVLPQIQEIRNLLQMRKTEEAKKIVEKDVVGLLLPYIDSEREKYDSAPDNLKTAPNVMNMINIVEQLENALGQFYNMDNGQLLPVEEWNLEAAQMHIEKAIRS